jgi:polysaccharide export outer membrane protein
MIHRTLFAAFVSLAGVVVFGCATSGMKPPPASQQIKAADAPYVIGIPDILRVTVWQHPDLDVQAPVRRDGKISVPLLDDVQAAGMTPEELKQSISKQLSASISRPDVTVIVVSPDSQVVSVVGGVALSGPVPLLRQMGVLEAIAAAGGFSAWANKNNVLVIRTVGKKRITYGFDYKGYVSGKPDTELFLLPGDLIVVPE